MGQLLPRCGGPWMLFPGTWLPRGSFLSGFHTFPYAMRRPLHGPHPCLALKIKIIAWQRLHDLLPLGVYVVKWHMPGNGFSLFVWLFPRSTFSFLVPLLSS